MGTIQFLGLQSGIDANAIITELVQLRRGPIQAMEQARDNLVFNRSVVQSVNSQLLRFNNMLFNLTLETTFKSRLVTSSADNLVSATGSVGASVGSHSISVSQLARASRVSSGVSGNLITRSVYLPPTNTAGINSITVNGAYQTRGAAASTLIKDTVQAGIGSAAITAGDTITISGNLKDSTAVAGTFTFAGDSTDTLGRLAQTIVSVFQGEVTASVGQRGEIILAEADPTVAGDITFNTTVSPYGIQFHDNDFSGSTLAIGAGNARAGGGAVAQQLTNTKTYTVGGAPATGATDLATLDQITGTLDNGDIIRITGANPDGSLINGGTGTYDFTYGVTGTTLAQFLAGVNGAYTNATLTLDSGRLVLTDTAGGTSQTAISLSFVDGAPNTTSFSVGSFVTTRAGAAQTAQVITTGPSTVEVTGKYFISGTQGKAGRLYGSTTVLDPSNTLGSYGVTVFNQLAIDPDGTGSQEFILVQGLSADSSVQDLVDAINEQVPTVTAQLVAVSGSYRLEIQANGGGRDLRVIDGLGGILDTLISIGATDLQSSTNDGTNTFAATSNNSDYTMTATQSTSGGAVIRTAATGVDGASTTRLIIGATVNAVSPGNGVAVAVTGKYEVLNTSPALSSVRFSAANIAASPTTKVPPIDIYASLAGAGFAITPQNSSASPGNHTDGTLVINGVSITVGDVTTTTVHEVMAQINSSGAGVAIRYDGGLNRFIMERNDLSSSGFTFGGTGNTSNLWTILGLTDDAGGYTIAGQADRKADPTVPLSDSGLTVTPTSGVFTVNGVAIYVDAGVDSLNDVIDRINNSQAGVTASYDEAADKFVLAQDLTKNPTATQIEVGAATDTSSFLAAMRLLPYTGYSWDVGSERQDAVFTVDEVEYTRATNTVSDIVSGVTFNLKGATSSPVTVDVAADTEKAITALLDFIVEYNTTIDQVNQQPLTKSEREELVPLDDDALATMTLDEMDEYNTRRNELRQRDFASRDSSMRDIARKIREMVLGLVSNDGAYRSIAQLGMATSSVGASADEARENRGMLLSPTTDREILEATLRNNQVLLSALSDSADDVHKLFATAVQSRVTATGSANLSSGISVGTSLRFTIGDGSGASAEVQFTPGNYNASTVLNRISSALVEAGLGSSILPYYDANYLLNFTSTRTDRSAEISLTDLSYGGDSLLTRLGVQPGTYLGINPFVYGGTAARTRNYVQNLTGIQGAIFERLRTGGAFDRQILNYEDSISRAEETLEAYETRLRNQFVSLETQLAKISSISQYVEAYLAATIAAAGNQNSSSST